MKQKHMYIERQPEISLKNEDGSIVEGIPPLSNEQYANQHWLNDKRFAPSEGFAAVMMGGRIQQAYKGNSDEIELEEDDYNVLVEVIEKPNPVAGREMSPEMGRQYDAFPISVMEASNKPRKKPRKAGKKNKPSNAAKSAPGDKTDTSAAVN